MTVSVETLAALDDLKGTNNVVGPRGIGVAKLFMPLESKPLSSYKRSPKNTSYYWIFCDRDVFFLEIAQTYYLTSFINKTGAGHLIYLEAAVAEN